MGDLAGTVSYSAQPVPAEETLQYVHSPAIDDRGEESVRVAERRQIICSVGKACDPLERVIAVLKRVARRISNLGDLAAAIAYERHTNSA